MALELGIQTIQLVMNQRYFRVFHTDIVWSKMLVENVSYDLSRLSTRTACTVNDGQKCFAFKKISTRVILIYVVLNSEKIELKKLSEDFAWGK